MRYDGWRLRVQGAHPQDVSLPIVCGRVSQKLEFGDNVWVLSVTCPKPTLSAKLV